MGLRGYSQQSWERRYRNTVARAFATVPYYREMWADAGTRLQDPVTTDGADLDSALAGLYPFSEPYEPRREPPAWLGELAELFETLMLTGDYQRDRPLFEVRDALLDWDRIGPRTARYHVVLSEEAEVADPALRTATAQAFQAAHDPALLGTDAQIARLGGAEHAAQLFLRRSLADLSTPSESRLSGKGEVLHDPRLGYLGARHRECGQVHVNWRRLHVRQSHDGTLFTLLRRRRPTLVNIALPGTAHLTPGRCTVHGTPILSVGEAGAP